MSTYTKTTWNTSDTITEAKLNNAEDGIESAHTELQAHLDAKAQHVGGLIYAYQTLGGF